MVALIFLASLAVMEYVLHRAETRPRRPPASPSADHGLRNLGNVLDHLGRGPSPDADAALQAPEPVEYPDRSTPEPPAVR